MDFKNRIVLITGASNGIGKRLALDLAARGAVIIACGRSLERLEAALAEIRRSSPGSIALRCDVGVRAEVESMIGKVLADLGAIDILINNAGIGMRRPFVETPVEMVEAITRTNYLGAVYCTHAVLPSMLGRGSGHIINISSIAGHMGTLNMAAYCASKFALNGFSESLYYELAPRGIHVARICPGPVRTEFNRSFAETRPKSPRFMIIEPEAVSRAAIRAIEKNRFEVIMPRSLVFVCAVKRFVPRLFRAACRRAFRSDALAAAKERAE